MTFLETRKEASKFLISLVKTIFSKERYLILSSQPQQLCINTSPPPTPIPLLSTIITTDHLHHTHSLSQIHSFRIHRFTTHPLSTLKNHTGIHQKKPPFKMQFTTILFSLLASTTLITAAPIPDGGITAGVITAVGVACAFQAEQCQKIGDGVKNGVVTVVSESGAAKVESAREDGGVIATIGDAIGGVMGGVKA
ncbi:hypothetical protein TWF751_002896 [Orbilia oligospora]|nr:hypothetical protein TWF751_002896 [Orbilia oligospora]